MIRALLERIRQKHRTMPYPQGRPTLPDRMRGRPIIHAAKCPKDCADCLHVCPTDALVKTQAGLQMDLGKCLFCADCAAACKEKAITFAPEHRMAVRQRQELLIGGNTQPLDAYRLATALEEKTRKLFGRSLRLRQVSAGGCNACEADTNVLNTVVFDLARFGIQFVASPRHADGLLITGPVTENMKLALLKTYEATPAPKIVIAVGACAISGGPYIDHPEVHNGATELFPVDLFVPGCPPHPLTILDGLLRLLDRCQ